MGELIMEDNFVLSEKRKELLKYLKEQFGEKSKIPQDILRVVEEQDKEFIRLLKEEFYKFKPKDLLFESSAIIIDRLAGEKLS